MAVCRYMVTCPKWPECRHGGFTARDTLLPGSHQASLGVFPSVRSGYRFTPLLRANPGGGLITPRMAAGTQDHPLKGGCPILLQGDSQVRLHKSHSKTGTVL